MGYDVKPGLFSLGLAVFIAGALAVYIGLQTYIGVSCRCDARIYQPEVPIGIMVMVVGYLIMIGSHLVKIHQYQVSKLRTVSHTNTA